MKRFSSLDLPPGIHTRHSLPEGVVVAKVEEAELQEGQATP